MNEDRAMEKEKILQVMEKYRDYFSEWNADVAFGVHRKNIFYVPASKDEFETFLFFQTANRLEGFAADKMDGEYGKSIEHYLPEFVQKLDVICKAAENWHNMMAVTFNSLKNICADIAEKEHKNP